MKKVAIIISSSCNPTTLKGAYGCIILTDDADFKFDGCYTNTTVNRLALLAVIRALKELDEIFPAMELNIQLVSNLNYLTLSFTPGKLRSNLQGGETLPNFDLWKEIFDLGIKHKWKVTPIKTVPLERYHKMAGMIAAGSATNVESKVDEGSARVPRKKTMSARPLFEEGETAQSAAQEISPAEPCNDVKRNFNDLPIIENNDPPF